jgi:hypothetical protein
MKALPEGKSLGWMQAPASWISSHTVRFVGAVRVVIQDGEGFILIKKGKPLFYYFKHGTIELKGHAARDYFNTHPVIEFDLCKYTPDEFAWALKICNIEDPEKLAPKEPAVDGPVSREPSPPSRQAEAPVAKPVEAKKIPEPLTAPPQVNRAEERTVASRPVPREPAPAARPAEAAVAELVGTVRRAEQVAVSHKVPAAEEKTVASRPVPREPVPAARPAEAAVVKPVETSKIPEPVAASSRVHRAEERTVASPPESRDEPDVSVISQIGELEGIVALSVFNEKHTVVMMGDADSEVLLNIGRKMLETARNITPRLSWGPFVHMTIQIPAGNMIIAPYHDHYLCMLTTRAINIGHIRRILRDLQQKEAPQLAVPGV